MSNEITLSAWQAELARYIVGDDGLTVTEIVAKLGLSRWRAKMFLAKALEDGRCVKGIGYRVDASGKAYRASVYRLSDNVALGKQRAKRFTERSAK